MFPQSEDIQTTNNLHECEISGSQGIYKMTWPALSIVAEIDRIKESNHEVKAELSISSSRITSPGHLRSGRINLTSTTARNSFAKSLMPRDSDIDWDLIMEQVAVSILREHRSGSPVQLLNGNMDAPALDNKWVVSGIVQKNNPTLIYAPGSHGKSWVAQWLAVLSDAGISAGGLEVEPNKVLYLDWETDVVELSSRVTMCRRGLGLTGTGHILYKAMTQGLAADIESIRKICVENSPGLLILDSLGSACGEPESAEVVLRTFSALRSLGQSSILIDHVSKAGGSPFGSVYKFNAARQVFEIKKSQEEDANKLVLALFHRKASNSRLRSPMGFELVFSPEDRTMTVIRKDVRDTPLITELAVKTQIENVLARLGKGTAKDIIDELNPKPDGSLFTENQIATELSNGTKEKKKDTNRAWFVRLPDKTMGDKGRWLHYYGLPARIEDEVVKIYQQELEQEGEL